MIYFKIPKPQQVKRKLHLRMIARVEVIEKSHKGAKINWSMILKSKHHQGTMSTVSLLKGSIGNNTSPKGRIKKFRKSWLSPFDLGPQTIPEALPAAFGTEEFRRTIPPYSQGVKKLKIIPASTPNMYGTPAENACAAALSKRGNNFFYGPALILTSRGFIRKKFGPSASRLPSSKRSQELIPGISKASCIRQALTWH